MSRLYLEGIDFLLVDDNAFSRHIVRMVLRSLGCRTIREATSGADALKELWHRTPDIVIADWLMQPISGIEFTREVRGRGDKPYSFLPVILLTAYSEEQHVVTACDAGVDEFVVKPFAARTLFDRIHRVIEKRRPFVKMEGYFGPDRRRQQQVHEGEERRGSSP